MQPRPNLPCQEPIEYTHMQGLPLGLILPPKIFFPFLVPCPTSQLLFLQILLVTSIHQVHTLLRASHLTNYKYILAWKFVA